MDAIYLYNKYGKPVPWEQWVAVREILGIYLIPFVYVMANRVRLRDHYQKRQAFLHTFKGVHFNLL